MHTSQEKTMARIAFGIVALILIVALFVPAARFLERIEREDVKDVERKARDLIAASDCVPKFSSSEPGAARALARRAIQLQQEICPHAYTIRGCEHSFDRLYVAAIQVWYEKLSATVYPYHHDSPNICRLNAAEEHLVYLQSLLAPRQP